MKIKVKNVLKINLDYIYLSDKDYIEKEEITKQLQKKYDIEFIYEKKNYKVSGCRLVII